MKKNTESNNNEQQEQSSKSENANSESDTKNTKMIKSITECCKFCSKALKSLKNFKHNEYKFSNEKISCALLDKCYYHSQNIWSNNLSIPEIISSLKCKFHFLDDNIKAIFEKVSWKELEYLFKCKKIAGFPKCGYFVLDRKHILRFEPIIMDSANASVYESCEGQSIKERSVCSEMNQKYYSSASSFDRDYAQQMEKKIQKKIGNEQVVDQKKENKKQEKNVRKNELKNKNNGDKNAKNLLEPETIDVCELRKNNKYRKLVVNEVETQNPIDPTNPNSPTQSKNNNKKNKKKIMIENKYAKKVEQKSSADSDFVEEKKSNIIKIFDSGWRHKSNYKLENRKLHDLHYCTQLKIYLSACEVIEYSRKTGKKIRKFLSKLFSVLFCCHFVTDQVMVPINDQCIDIFKYNIELMKRNDKSAYKIPPVGDQKIKDESKGIYNMLIGSKHITFTEYSPKILVHGVFKYISKHLNGFIPSEYFKIIQRISLNSNKTEYHDLVEISALTIHPVRRDLFLAFTSYCRIMFDNGEETGWEVFHDHDSILNIIFGLKKLSHNYNNECNLRLMAKLVLNKENDLIPEWLEYYITKCHDINFSRSRYK